MQIHDRVTATYAPHYGIGVVEWVAPNGGVLVTFEVDGQAFEDCYHPSELQPVAQVPA